MSSDAASTRNSVQTNVVYDKVNGRVLGQFRRYDLVQEAYCPCDAEEALKLFRSDEKALAEVTDHKINNLSVLTTALSPSVNISDLCFSLTRQELVSKARLQLRTDRDVLEGNGEDSVTIFIAVVDERGNVLRKSKGGVHVTTSRGKLSAKGGQVEITQGQGQVTLTSVKETVDRVWVRAIAPHNSAISDSLRLRFE